jgi:endoglucanase
VGVGSSYDYADVLHRSLLFYEAQRSGPLDATNRVPWRANSAMADVGANGEDLTGG